MGNDIWEPEDELHFWVFSMLCCPALLTAVGSEVSVQTVLYPQEKTSNHYLLFLPPRYQLTRLYPQQQDTSG